MGEFKHYTVMPNECMEYLNPRAGKIYVDATLGGGGHSHLIAQKIGDTGKLFSFDVDVDALEHSKERLKDFKNVEIVHDSYTNIHKNLQNFGIEKITGGIIFDLGASYHQLKTCERGFSFNEESRLDMRFDQDQRKDAYEVINKYSELRLVEIFSNYGQERFSKRIAHKIIQKRPLTTTKQLADLIIEATPKIKSSIHPATRVFQALRIEVNNELQNVKNTLNELLPFLDDGAIIIVLSFHSLEDRIIKNTFKENAAKGELQIITKKPLTASGSELKENKASRSAKLRAAIKINHRSMA